MHRRTALLLLGGIAASVTGCSSDAEPAPSPTTTPLPTTPPPTPTPTPEPEPEPQPDPGPRWPLTGRPLDDAAAAHHAAIAVKVPDNRNEHPQAGLNEADLVFVQLEGYADARGESSTRLVPVFHSQFPARVAPVRSVRPVDVPLFAPMRAVIASTGHSEWVGNYARRYSDFIDVSLTNLNARRQGAYSVDRSRVRTVSGKTYFDRAIVCHPEVLVGLAPEPFSQGPAQPYLPYALTEADISTTNGQPAHQIRVPWKATSNYTMTYDWDADAGVYLRSEPWGPHILADGQRVTTDNVLVIRARQSVEKLADGAGVPDPVHAIIDNDGTFFYAHGGRVTTGQWTKGPVEAPFVFTCEDGRPLAMAPGRTFIELPNIDADVQIS